MGKAPAIKSSKNANIQKQRKVNKSAIISDEMKRELVNYFKDMVLIRRFEEKAGQLYGMGLIGGFCHLYIGQEAVVVGMQAVINDNSSVVTSY